MAYTKRDAAVSVKRSLFCALTELQEAQSWAAETGDRSLLDKVTNLKRDTQKIREELAAKLDSETG